MKKVHFIGIGGIGMSGLASILLERGVTVSGSDLRPNNLTDDLARRGAKIYEGHDAANIDSDVDVIVETTCIKDDNPEILRSKDLGKEIISRSALLKMMVESSPVSIGVTGTHGKTTTSALISFIMDYCGKNPTVVVGGEIDRFKGNAREGKGGILIAEVDESDGYFRNISTTYAVVTNIEREHMEHFGTLENLVGAYEEFIGRVSPEGLLVYNGEDPVLCKIAGSVNAGKIDFGIDGDFTATCRDHKCARSIEFDFIVSGKKYGRVKSPLVGRHNLMNILAAITVCLEMGLDFERCVKAVNDFRGVKRRFDAVGKVGSIRVIEDYAHHPTELKAVIKAARDYNAGRVVAVFQPHRYSRTKDLAEEFANCFYDADVLVLTEIYSADEDPSAGGDVRDIFELVDKDRFQEIDFVKKDEVPGLVSGLVKENDLVLVLGAGDIRDIAHLLLDEIRKRQPDVE